MSTPPPAQRVDKDAAAIHALLIGVSDYPDLYEDEDDPAPEEHLGLRKLASPALTVYRVHEWLERRRKFLPLPLATCRALVSPSVSELRIAQGLADWTDRPTLENVLTAIEQWRHDLSRNPNSIALLYFAGHGVKRERRDDVLLLDGFGKKSLRVLKHAIDSTSLIDGMAPSKQFPNIARTQLYFFDACRVKPILFKKYEEMDPDPIWDKTELAKIDDRSTLILYTTVPGAKAYGSPDDQSLFSHALIRCLNGAAAESSDPSMADWSVTGMSLVSQVQTQLDLLNREYDLEQLVEIGKSPTRDFVLNRLEGPPAVNIRLHIEPEAARPWAKVSVLDQQDDSAWELPFPVKPLPYQGKLSAGIYRVLAQDAREHPEWGPGRWLLRATPQTIEWPLLVPPFKGT